jgi:hypothetical protein
MIILVFSMAKIKKIFEDRYVVGRKSCNSTLFTSLYKAKPIYHIMTRNCTVSIL